MAKCEPIGGVIANIPFFEQVARDLRAKGVSEQELTGRDLGTLLSSVVAASLRESSSVEADLDSMSVRIESGAAAVSCVVRIRKPIDGIVDANLLLANDQTPSRIRLVSLSVGEKAGFLVRMALNALGIQRRAREMLSDPNEKVGAILAGELGLRGVELTAMKLQFRESTLSVLVKGGPVGG